MKSSLVKAYVLQHELEVKDLIDAYYGILTRILDELWNSLTWTRKGRRSIPYVRKDKPFKKSLRDECLADWAYSKHYVDSAIRQAYSMMKSWRKLYLKGRAGRVKPVLKRKFVRVKRTLYSCRDGVIKVSIKPFERNITIDLKQAWFWERIRGLELGELILKEDLLIVTVKRNVELKVENPMAWDSNLLMLNGYDGVRDCEVSLKKMYTAHRTYELKRRKIQLLPEKTRKRLMGKYRLRERRKVHDELHKIAKGLSNRTNVFEDLRGFKERVARTKSKSINRQNSKHDYLTLMKYVEYKAGWNGYRTFYVQPKGTSKTCSKCGYYNKDLRRAKAFKCPKCSFEADRHANAARNIWQAFLKMWRDGFPPKGAKPDEKPPMNPEGDEGYEAQGLRTPMKDYVTQNPFRSLYDIKSTS